MKRRENIYKQSEDIHALHTGVRKSRKKEFSFELLFLAFAKKNCRTPEKITCWVVREAIVIWEKRRERTARDVCADFAYVMEMFHFLRG